MLPSRMFFDDELFKSEEKIKTDLYEKGIMFNITLKKYSEKSEFE